MSRKEYVGPFGPLLWAMDRRDGLRKGTWAVLVAIAKHCDPKGCCHPSMGRLSDTACLSERSVIRAVADLEMLGYLRIERGNGRGHSSNYRLPFDQPEQRFVEPKPGNGKGDKMAPFKPLKGDKTTPFRGPERVTKLQKKGDKLSPQLLKEESTKRPAMKNSEGEGARSPAPVPPDLLPQPASASAEDRAPKPRPSVVGQVVRGTARAFDGRPRPEAPRSIPEQRAMILSIPGGRVRAEPQAPTDTPAGQLRRLHEAGGLTREQLDAALASLPAVAVA